MAVRLNAPLRRTGGGYACADSLGNFRRARRYWHHQGCRLALPLPWSRRVLCGPHLCPSHESASLEPLHECSPVVAVCPGVGSTPVSGTGLQLPAVGVFLLDVAQNPILLGRSSTRRGVLRSGRAVCFLSGATIAALGGGPLSVSHRCGGAGSRHRQSAIPGEEV